MKKILNFLRENPLFVIVSLVSVLPAWCLRLYR